MKKNENNTDRIIRIILGITLLYLGFSVFSGLLQTISYVVGILSLFTGITGFCAIYLLLDISTLKSAKN